MKRCVVVVEEGRVCDAICAVLTENGLKTVSARTADDALRLIQADVTNLVVLDWDLPDLGALDVLAGAASITADDGPRILMIAAECEPSQLALARAAGVTDYTTKPIDEDALRAMVSELEAAEPGRAA